MRAISPTPLGSLKASPEPRAVSASSSTTTSRAIPGADSTAAAIGVGTVALMVLPAHPILLGTLVAEHRLAQAQVGLVATLEILLLALGAGVGTRLLARGAMRLKVLLALSVAVSADLLGVVPTGVTAILCLRAVAGLCEGLALSAAILIMMRSARPDRLNGVFLAVSTVPQVALVIALPILIVPRMGSAGCFVVLAAIAAIGAAAVPWLTGDVAKADDAGSKGTVWSGGVILCLAAVLLQNAAVGGAWDYLQLLANQKAFGPTVVAVGMAGCLTLQVLGALAVSVWGGRIACFPALLFSSLAQAVVITGLAFTHDAPVFIALLLLFGLFWMAVSPFQVRLLIDLEKSRQAAQVQSPVVLAGLCLGPTICSLAVHGAGVTGVFLVAVGLMAGALVLYAASLALLTRRRPPLGRPAPCSG